jgi:hypothetical protein
VTWRPVSILVRLGERLQAAADGLRHSVHLLPLLRIQLGCRGSLAPLLGQRRRHRLVGRERCVGGRSAAAAPPTAASARGGAA